MVIYELFEYRERVGGICLGRQGVSAGVRVRSEESRQCSRSREDDGDMLVIALTLVTSE